MEYKVKKKKRKPHVVINHDLGVSDEMNTHDVKLRGDRVNHSEESNRQDWEKRFLSIMEDIEDGYIEVNLNGTTTLVNNSMCRILGYPRDQLIGMNYTQYMHPVTARRVYQTFNKVFRTGVPNKAFDYEIRRRDGYIRYIEISISLIRNAKRQLTGFRGIVRDITERKRTERELQEHRSRLVAIFGSVKDAIITVDTTARIMEANRATETICGVSTDKFIGTSFWDWPGFCEHLCREVLKETLKNKLPVRERQIECRRSKQFRQKVSISCSPLLDMHGRFLGAVTVIRDITRLKDLERELKERHRFQNIIGKSSKMQSIFNLLEDLSSLATTVLISGESGTGKELVAKALHYSGNRAPKPFVTADCSALSENLLESELFGHVKGAFTGAIRNTQGRFQSADGGTILLDEIGEISSQIQVKLLRVLQEKSFQRVGESGTTKTDVRVIACTNRDLKKRVLEGKFREDLYYRLKVVEIELPPLRERIEDVPLLVEHFLQIFNTKFKKNIKSLSHNVLRAFMNYSWPGNIRELEHTMERAFVLCREETIELEQIPSEIRSSAGAMVPGASRRTNKDPKVILETLEKTAWNKARAARLLGISRRTLYRKLAQYNITRPDGW